jgi:hypothetical protein
VKGADAVNSIDPGLTGRKTSIAIPTKIAKKAVDNPPGEEDAIAAWLRSFGPLPFAVPIADAQKILGRKARSQIYEAIGRGELEAVKDGNKTLVIVSSIISYCSRMKSAKIKPPTPRKKTWPTRSPKSAAAVKRSNRPEAA